MPAPHEQNADAALAALFAAAEPAPDDGPSFAAGVMARVRTVEERRAAWRRAGLTALSVAAGVMAVWLLPAAVPQIAQALAASEADALPGTVSPHVVALVAGSLGVAGAWLRARLG